MSDPFSGPTASRLSQEQREQLIEWFAAGESPAAVWRRITLQNERGDGLAPWTGSISRATVYRLRDEIAGETALIAAKRLEVATLTGLAERGRQANFLADQVTDMQRQIDTMTGAWEDLVTKGALRFNLDEMRHDSAAGDTTIIEGEVVGKTQKPPALVAEAQALGLDPVRIWLVDKAFDRAIDLGKLLVLYRQQQAKLVEVLGRVAATIDNDKPIDYEGKRRRAQEVMAELDRRRQALVPDPDLDDDDDA